VTELKNSTDTPLSLEVKLLKRLIDRLNKTVKSHFSISSEFEQSQSSTSLHNQIQTALNFEILKFMPRSFPETLKNSVELLSNN
jgi:hypothetical protein